MQINELVTFAADVGRGLLESGAETSRVEDTVERIIRHFYDGKSEVLVVMTGLFVTVGDVTKTVRVRRRTINLDKVSKINMMSRDIADDKIDFEEALKRFEYIMEQKPYSLWVKTVAVAFCCGFFTLLFGGNQCFYMVFEKTSHGGVYYNIFGRSCYCVADITLLCNRFGKKY